MEKLVEECQSIRLDQLEDFFHMVRAQETFMKWVADSNDSEEIKLYLEGLERNYKVMLQIIPSGFESFVEYVQASPDPTEFELEFLSKIDTLAGESRLLVTNRKE